ncbi:acyl-CoA-binding protein (ACBP)/diazepam binding inhibitor (DBI)/endozepine (EP) [Maublancomyces gigas]|uniref:Acyl-CoA-binding protein (ACBP)/diazepam binding inhibitor (DBI)/endozepine (EP) n=1 Tax=Discina gigas TaxID=1032678 RepID=A0ABR3GFW9_9PEZI
MTFTPSQEFTTIAAEVKAARIDVSDATRLKLYGLYKQTMFGDTDQTEPWVTSEATAKTKAWVLVKGTAREDAQAQYIADAKSILGTPK